MFERKGHIMAEIGDREDEELWLIALEDNHDVQQVYANYDIAEEIMAKLEEM